MDATFRLARAARRRLTIVAVLGGVGRGIGFGSAASLVAISFLYFRGNSLNWWLIPSIGLVAGGILGGSWAFLRRPSIVDAAQLLDDKLNLKSRLSNALALVGPSASADVFSQAAIDEANTLAPGVRPRGVIPLTVQRSFAAWLALGAVAFGLGWLAFERPRSRSSSDENPSVELARRTSRESIADAVRTISAAPEVKHASRSQLDELRSIEAELARGADPVASSREAAKVLEAVAAQQEREALEARARKAEVEDTLRSLPTPPALARTVARETSARTDSASRLIEALRSGDLERAASEAERASESQSAARSAAERGSDASEAAAKAAQELEEIARDLEAMSREKPSAQDTPPSRSQGVGVQNPPASKVTPPRETEREANRTEDKKSQADDRNSQRPSPQEPSSSNAQQPSAEENPPTKDSSARARPENDDARTATDRIKDALRDAARELRETHKATRQTSDREEDGHVAERERAVDRVPGERSENTKEPERQTASEKPDSAVSQPIAEKQPSSEKQPSAEKSPPGEAQSSAQKPSSSEKPSSSKGVAQDRTSSTEGSNGERNNGDGNQRDGNQQRSTEGGSQGLRRLADELTKLAKEGGEGAASRQRQGEDLLRQAQGMVEQASSISRERDRQPAGQDAQRADAGRDANKGWDADERLTSPQASGPERGPGAGRLSSGEARSSQTGESAGPAVSSGNSGDGTTRGGTDPRRTPGEPKVSSKARTEPVDARRARESREATRGRVAAEWLGEGDRTGTQAAKELGDRIQTATRSAERAIEDRTVPSRFDSVLQRYFRTLPESVSGATNPPAKAEPAPAIPAKDAP